MAVSRVCRLGLRAVPVAILVGPLVLAFTWLWAVPAGAGIEPLVPIPALSARVTDAAGLLSAEERQGLEQRLARIETEHGAQLAVLIVPTIAPESIEAYSLRVVEAWRLGRRGVDDGVLILVVVKERGLRIEVGRGLEGAIPDAVAKRLIAEVIAPRFAERDYVGGLTSGIERIGALIAGESLPAPARARRGDNTSTAENGGIESVLVVALMFALLVGSVLKALLGRLLGGALTGGLVGLGVWMVSGSLFVAILAAVLALVFVSGRGGGGPFIGGGMPGRGGFGGRPGGGWGGGFGGGGGSFGGGGASGRW